MTNELAIVRRLTELSGRPFTTAEAARLVGLSGPKALRRLEARGVVDAPYARSAACHLVEVPGHFWH
jgi:hypothetical protein